MISCDFNKKTAQGYRKHWFCVFVYVGNLCIERSFIKCKNVLSNKMNIRKVYPLAHSAVTVLTHAHVGFRKRTTDMFR